MPQGLIFCADFNDGPEDPSKTIVKEWLFRRSIAFCAANCFIKETKQWQFFTELTKGLEFLPIFRLLNGKTSCIKSKLAENIPALPVLLLFSAYQRRKPWRHMVNFSSSFFFPLNLEPFDYKTYLLYNVV